ncbi:MAG: hypothetical protein IJ424_00500 [Oscillospiraceae bacterium]|nr:hypothetical protein [Oscillospiraceae bacterium]
MSAKSDEISEEKVRQLLFEADEFAIILKRGRRYVTYINPEYKKMPIEITDECVAKLVVERCRQRFEFDTTGNLVCEYKLMQDIKMLVQRGMFLYTV